MQHVTRLSGSRLQARILLHNNHVRSTSSLTPSGGEENQEDTPLTTQSLRSRSHGNPSLPLSALFDPVKIAARTKHEEPKPLPSQNPQDLTDFQKELATNVHALALATPIRTCVLTKARLPSHFLIPFISQLPPKKKPTTITTTPPLTSQEVIPTQPSVIPRIGTWAPYSSHPSSYVLSHHSAVSHLSGPRLRKKNKGGGKWALLVNERMKKPWAVRQRKAVDKISVAKEWEWDEEMGGRVKVLLGREVVRRVGWCAKDEVGGEILVGREGEGVVVRVGGEGEIEEGGYDLRGMIDQEGLDELRRLFDGAEEFVLKRHPSTVYTILAIEALKNYVEGDEI